MTEQPCGQHEPKPPPLWRRLVSKHPFRRGSLFILLVLVVEYLVLPKIAGLGHSLQLLRRVNIGFVMLGVLLEVASLASYAVLSIAVLPPRASRVSRIWRIDLSTLAISHVLPGGTAGGDGLGYRPLTNEGVSGDDAGLALAIQAIGSVLVLNAILWLALIVSIPLTGFNPIYATAALVGALLLAAFATLVLLLTKGEERAAVTLRNLVTRVAVPRAECRRHRRPPRAPGGGKDPCHGRRSLSVAPGGAVGRGQLAVGCGIAVPFLAAFGKIEDPDGLLVTYGLA